MQELIMRRIEHRAAIRCSAAIALTESAIVELDRRYNYVVSPKATVITTCADLDRFQASTMPPMPLRVLLSGTLNRYYDLQSMLDLVAELRRRRPVEFIVASPGDTGWEAELSAVEAVRVSATPDEMKDLVASCHLGLSVCRDDAGVSLLAAMPTKIGEFLAAGRPVVVNPGLVDATTLLVQERCGVTYGQTSSCGLGEVVDRLEALLVDPVTPDRCRSLAESHFDLDTGVDRLIGVYRSIGE
jgi:glycosyltransferase involved in cell wall biosynthesis